MQLFTSYGLSYAAERIKGATLVTPMGDPERNLATSQILDAVVGTYENGGAFTLDDAKLLGAKTLQVARNNGITEVTNTVVQMGDIVVKMFGTRKRSALRQFFVMNALSGATSSSQRISFPRQYAIVIDQQIDQATIIMDVANGVNLYSAINPYFLQDRVNGTQLYRGVADRVCEYIDQILGEELHPILKQMVDDIPPKKNMRNIFVDRILNADDELDLGTLLPFSIIDQGTMLRSAVLHPFASLLLNVANSKTVVKTV